MEKASHGSRRIAVMTVEGHMENGHVVLHAPLPLPDGAKIVVTSQSEASAEGDEQLPTLYERLKSVAGKIDGLPEDFAINHDHYLHGQPKRQ
jgi:hypothetical protein